MLWPTILNLVPKNYHGEAFEGNACRNLLKTSDNLNNPEIYADVRYFKIAPYIAAFKAINKIVVCFFTSGKVGPSLGDDIIELQKALESITYYEFYFL